MEANKDDSDVEMAETNSLFNSECKQPRTYTSSSNQQSNKLKLILGRVSKWPWNLVLIILLVTFLLLFLVFLICFLTITNKQDVCLTEHCVSLSGRIRSLINVTVDPCEDFYEFACGGWMESNVIPEEAGRFTVLLAAGIDVDMKLRGLLEGRIKLVNVTIPMWDKAISLYNVCMNESHIDKLGDQPLRDYIRDHIGYWPVYNDSGQNDFELEKDLGKFSGAFLSTFVDQDNKNVSQNVIHLDEGELFTIRDYYEKGDGKYNLDSWKKYFVSVIDALEPGKHNATVKVAEEVMNLDIELSQLLLPASYRREPENLYHKYTLLELIDEFPGFDWRMYFNEWLASSQLSIEDNEPIVVKTPESIKEIIKLVNSKRNNNTKLLANYMKVNHILKYVILLGKTFQKIYEEYQKATTGASKMPPRWKLCTEAVKQQAEYILGRAYSERFYSEADQQVAKDMTSFIRSEFRDILEEQDWMDEVTQKEAMVKARTMREKIGVPEWIMDDGKLLKYYDGIVVDKSFLTCYSHNDIWLARKQIQKLRKPVDDTWYVSPAVVNAFYNPNRNTIMFPAGILNPPFYHSRYPMYANFGAIGSVIGHEVTHGFDDRGRKYDAAGIIRDWWSETSAAAFNDKARCMVDQYNGYELADIGAFVNGSITIGENIADNGGVKESFRAYNSWLREKEVASEAKLPALDFTPNQLFFLSYIQVWCGKARPKFQRATVNTSPHTNGRYRGIGVLQNSLEFSEAFHCKVGSTMNPQHKCHIW